MTLGWKVAAYGGSYWYGFRQSGLAENGQKRPFGTDFLLPIVAGHLRLQSQGRYRVRIEEI